MLMESFQYVPIVWAFGSILEPEYNGFEFSSVVPDLCEIQMVFLILTILWRSMPLEGYNVCWLGKVLFDSLNRHGSWFGVCTNNRFPCSRYFTNEDPDFPFACIRVALVHNTSSICSFYRPQSDGIWPNLLKRLMLSNFSVHHEECLIYSKKIDEKLDTSMTFALHTNWPSSWISKPVLSIKWVIIDGDIHFPRALARKGM